jgi:type I restriction enzyme S subunit
MVSIVEDIRHLGELDVIFLKGVGLNKSSFSEVGNVPGIHYGQLFTEYGPIIKQVKFSVADFDGSVKSKVNDVLMPTSDVTPNGLAKASSVLAEGIVLGGDILVIRPNPNVIYGPYLSHYIRFSPDQIKSLVSGSTVYHIYAKDLREFRLFLPSIVEQKAIAKALSDVDELIAGLNLEIEKNESIKNGLVQKNLIPLLSKSKLKDHAILVSGGTPLTSIDSFYGGNIPWVSITDMTESGKYIERTARNLTQSGLLNSSAVIYPKNTLLFAMYASIGKCALPTVPVSSSQAILGITVKPSLNIDYLYYILTSRTQDFIAMGQQGTQSNLNKIIVGDFDIPILPLMVQERIASEFITVDLKIDLLKSELTKYECIKQGMAQDLLTGKVRLV